MSASRARRGPARDWFTARGWRVLTFQARVWREMARGRSGLLHAPTGTGKTLAVWLGAVDALHAQAVPLTSTRRGPAAPALTVLWVTPLRALVADTERALHAPLDELGVAWTVGSRSGDTSSAERARQSRRLPTALVITPESLSLLLSRAESAVLFASLRLVVVDEWHELVGNKRGVQVQLALARLRRWHSTLLVWGLSATLGQPEEALAVLVPTGGGVLVTGSERKRLRIDCLLPANVERFPWAGHLGLRMLPQVVTELDASATTLVFTNTRAQCERWYQALIEARPDWAGVVALHHGSLSRPARDWVETALKAGRLKAVVCTSSLDLGVDFPPVERVLHIGSPKGVARLVQRAGRSGHGPGRVSRLTLVPTQNLDLVEAAAARDALVAGQLENRPSPHQPLDVLVQHLVTVALGGGFEPCALRAEVMSTAAYRALGDDEWQWALDFVRQGGAALTAYPEYRRVEADADGVWRVPDRRVAWRHRMSIGTIVGDASMDLRFWRAGGRGARLGSVEESFIARLRPGDQMLFAGRRLELVRVENLIAYVRLARSAAKARVPRWNGGRMPLSTELAHAVLARLSAAARGACNDAEMRCLRPMLEVQARWSALPTVDTLLIETWRSREGWHVFVYPFAGRNVHLGLASVLAWRAMKHAARSVSLAVNDYGFEILTPTSIDWSDMVARHLLDHEHLREDLLDSLNATELARRRFRGIARVAGLVFSGPPQARKSTRQLQASSSLFYEVFRQYDPGNRLLAQAQDEVLSEELEFTRLRAAVSALRARRLDVYAIERPTPLAFPLVVERMRESASSETATARIARMLAELEAAAAPGRRDDSGVAPRVAASLRVAAPRDKRMRARKDGRPRRAAHERDIDP